MWMESMTMKRKHQGRLAAWFLATVAALSTWAQGQIPVSCDLVPPPP